MALVLVLGTFLQAAQQGPVELIPRTFAELVAGSDRIVIGTCLQTMAVWDHGLIVTRVSLSVRRGIQLSRRPTMKIVTGFPVLIATVALLVAPVAVRPGAQSAANAHASHMVMLGRAVSERIHQPYMPPCAPDYNGLSRLPSEITRFLGDTTRGGA